MMATPGFPVYQDKENVSSIGSHPKARNRHGVPPVAKIFGSNSVRNEMRTPARKALGSVNREPSVATPNFFPSMKDSLGLKIRKQESQGVAPTPINRQPLGIRPINTPHQNEQLMKTPKLKPSCIELCKPKSKVQAVVKEQVSDKVKQEDDEIETMFMTRKEEDDFEDIWPKKDRPTSYLNALINWRPPCFGDWEEEEKRDDEERRRLILAEINAADDLLQILDIDKDIREFEICPMEFLPVADDIPIPDIPELKED